MAADLTVVLLSSNGRRGLGSGLSEGTALESRPKLMEHFRVDQT